VVGAQRCWRWDGEHYKQLGQSTFLQRSGRPLAIPLAVRKACFVIAVTGRH
jgi:hypothetical protein